MDLEADSHMGRMPCEDEGRDWGAASMSRGMPNIASQPLKAGREAQTRPSVTPSEETNPATTLILAFWSPELRDNKFLLFKLPSVWHFLMAALKN